MIQKRKHFFGLRERRGIACAFSLPLLLLLLLAMGMVFRPQPAAPPDNASSPAPQTQPKDDAHRADHPGIAEELPTETREAAGEEDDTAQFKSSASVRVLARITGLDLKHAYWLAVLLNFVVMAGVLGWAGRKYLPGMFRERTAAIQRAMEEARRAVMEEAKEAARARGAEASQSDPDGKVSGQ